ncbi:hypothetical protein SNK04_014215 [Fusarium graminearum]
MAVVEKRGKKWRAMVRIKPHPTASKTFNGRKAAEDWARITEDALRAGLPPPQESMTLEALIDRYIKEMDRFKPVSATKRGNLRRWVESLGDREKWWHPPGPATMAMELGFLAEALAAGRSLWNMTIPDVVTAARPVLRRAGAIAKPEERDRRPTEKELEELASFYKFNFGAIPMRDLIPFAIDSAMRMGEIVALRWEDYRGGDKPMILIRDRKDPKIKKGNNQWVPLLGRTAAIIEGQDRQGSLIFPTRRTASARHSAVPIEDLHFHDLRHEGTSRLFEQGYTIPEVAIVTGHRDWKSLKRYTQLAPASLHRPESNLTRPLEDVYKPGPPSKGR